MTPTEGTVKASADALEDNQFDINLQEDNNEQKDPSSENQLTKKKRKRNNGKKHKTPLEPTAEPTTQEATETSPNNPGNDENLPPKKKKKSLTSEKKSNPSAPDENQAVALARLKDKKKSKAQLKRQQIRAIAKEAKDKISSTLAESVNESSSIGLQPPNLQLDYLQDRQKRALSDLSDLELESFPLKKVWLEDVSDKPLRAHLGPWLKSGAVPGLLESLNETTDVPGAPVVLVITSAALRAVDLYREMRQLVENPKKSGQVTKLFAKHFKLQDHIKHVKATKISIGVGTPHRISTLLSTRNDKEEGSEEQEEVEALRLDRLKFIIFDLTWLDSKSYNLTELPDSILKNSLWKSLLGFPELIKKFQAGQTKLVLF